ncbi:unnamed protein product [Caenorhabditis angaria]|uniref:Uncharacterized protein n=1 Tax=Caenorhabditis angaria TaxID=860376 RepID=A0A9P1MYJ9_9PELO|nr:unnamed protein product [Caenorhabditis angaria]
MKTKICINIIIFQYFLGFLHGISPQCQNAAILDRKYNTTWIWFLFAGQENKRDRQRATYIIEQLLCELPIKTEYSLSLGYKVDERVTTSMDDGGAFAIRLGPEYNHDFKKPGDCAELEKLLFEDIKKKEDTVGKNWRQITLIFIFPAVDECGIYDKFKKSILYKNHTFFGIHFDNTKSEEYVSLNIPYLRNFDVHQKVADPNLVMVIKEFARQILGLKKEEEPEEFVDESNLHSNDHLWVIFYILLYLLANFLLAGLIIVIVSFIKRRIDD